MYFPFVRVDCNPRQTVGQDTVNDGLDFGTFRGDDIHHDGPPSIGQIHSIPIVKIKSDVARANPINEAFRCTETLVEASVANPFNEPFRSNQTPAIDLEDKMEPEDMNAYVGNNSAWEMWIGCEFPNWQTLQNTLAKFAIYGNFTLRPLKTNMTKVTDATEIRNVHGVFMLLLSNQDHNLK